MKKFLLIIALTITGSLCAEAQTRVVVSPPIRRVVVVRQPVVVVPARRVVAHPHVTVIRPVVAVPRPMLRRPIVIVHH